MSYISPGCQALYKKLTNEQKNSETNTENLESLGIELIPAAKRWGLLPSQFAVVLEAMETEKQLLKVGFWGALSFLYIILV